MNRHPVTTRYILRLAVVVTILLTVVSSPGAQSPADFVPVTDEMLRNPPPGDWLMWRRTLDGWGYSPLDDVTTQNVDQIRLVWSRALSQGTQENVPIAYGGVLYVPLTRDGIHAIDATTGDLLWEYARDLPEDIFEVMGGNSRNNRNMAIYDRLLINTSADSYVYAVDAVTGDEVWETQVVDYLGQPGHAEFGTDHRQWQGHLRSKLQAPGGPDACVITAHDALTGKELWRRRTIPGPGEPGDETWGGVPFEDRKHVGTWMVPSYDPELDLIFIGTSVTSPAPKFLLGGTDLAHLYHNCTLALDADTGEIRWYYQHLNDHWDLDHPFERILVDTTVAPDTAEVSWINPRIQPGETRKVVTGIPGKSGIVYTLDRETGEFLWAKPTITQNVVSHIDGATGDVTENSEVVFTGLGQEVLACPTWQGPARCGARGFGRNGQVALGLRDACGNHFGHDDRRRSRLRR